MELKRGYSSFESHRLCKWETQIVCHTHKSPSCRVQLWSRNVLVYLNFTTMSDKNFHNFFKINSQNFFLNFSKTSEFSLWSFKMFPLLLWNFLKCYSKFHKTSAQILKNFLIISVTFSKFSQISGIHHQSFTKISSYFKI